jgi:hypothetical protein
VHVNLHIGCDIAQRGVRVHAVIVVFSTTTQILCSDACKLRLLRQQVELKVSHTEPKAVSDVSVQSIGLNKPLLCKLVPLNPEVDLTKSEHSLMTLCVSLQHLLKHAESGHGLEV